MAIIVSDSFNRADSSTLGTADTGQSWVNLSGSFQIIGNEASVSSSGEQFAVIDSGISDGRVSAYLYHGDANGYQSKLAFRALDSNNIFFIDHTPSSSSTSGNYRLLLKRSGSYTSLATTTAGEFPSPYLTKVKITVELNGTEIKWYINDTLARTVTNSYFTTHTKHGIGGERNTARIDDYLVESLSTGGTNVTITGVLATATAESIVPTVSAQQQVSVSAVIANASAEAIAPTVSTAGAVNISVPVATAAADAPTPAISTGTTIVSVVATATAEALAPIVGSFTNITVNAVAADATATANAPSVSVVRNISIGAVIADAIASFLAPRIVTGPFYTPANVVFSSTIKRSATHNVTITRNKTFDTTI